MPQGMLGRPLVGGLLLCLLLAGGWEAWWRHQGLVAGVTDDDALWSRNRLAASDGDTGKLVIIGSSRALYGLVPEVLAEVTGREVIQLSITNSHPWKVLEHLAKDPDFKGTVLMEVAPENFVAAAGHKDSKYDHVERRLGHCDRSAVSPSERIEGRLSTRLSSALVLRQPGLSPLHLAALHVDAGPGAPEVSPYVMRWDRQAWLNPDVDKKHWRGAAVATVKDFGEWTRWLRAGHYPTKAQYAALEARFQRALDQLRGRGGDVVMVALPMGSRLGALQNKAFPAEKFWDPWVARSGLISIKSTDFDSLSRYEPVDESHLCKADARAFSRALGELLLRLQAGPRPRPVNRPAAVPDLPEAVTARSATNLHILGLVLPLSVTRHAADMP